MFHHAATDEWSVDIFLRELSRLLSVEGDPEAAGLPACRWQYTDFTSWHIGALDGGLREIQSAFWKDRLADLSGMMRLSPDRVMPQGVPGRSGRIELPLPQTLTSRLRMLSEREGLSLFTLLLSSFHVLLHRWSGEEDIVVGTPVSLRRRAEWQDMMGCFLNTVPVRMGVSGEESFLVFSRRMKSEWERILMHSEIPFTDIAACAGGMEAVPFHAFLQVMFTITGQSGDGGFHTGLSESTRPMETVAVDDLSCLVDVAGGEWKVVFKFDADRFEEARMRRMSETFRHLLDVLTSDPNTALCSLPLMDDGLERGMLSLGQGRITPLPERPLIHRIFSIQSMRTPSEIAIEERESTVTYSELESMSDRMACHLVKNHGVHAGEVLAVLLPTGVLQLTCLLAAWKAGACVVPIDPLLPEARIMHMLKESGASAVLTATRLEAPSLKGLRTIDATTVPDHSFGLPPQPAAVTDPRAYCMFTSGSTGSPKGVFNSHAGFVSMIVALSSRAAITEDDRVLQYSMPTFDVSLFEAFIALFNGARLVIAGRTEIPVLPAFMSQRGVTVATLTPLVIGMTNPEDLCRLRVLFTGGEEARPSDLVRLSGKVSVFNIYGPTECSVWSTLFHVPSGWDASRKVPIGRPIDNVIVRILDAYGHPVPPGMEGEIHISGTGVGLGYIGDGTGLSSAFLSDPSDADVRIYRTGDMGRWTEEGDILFCGRRDAQVKVMGVRIETEEVRTAVEKLSEVEQAYVMIRNRAGTEPVMICFVVTNDGRRPDAAGVRDRLAELLPSYMLPARVHGIERLPKTRHGKTDRLKLEELDEAFLAAQESREEGVGFEAPVGPYEKRLAALWRSLLGIPAVGRQDGFFDLGGDSIGLIRLMEAVRSEWGFPIEISRVYSHLSLKRMASMIQIQREGMIRSEAASESSGVVAVWDPPGGRNVFVMVGGAGQPEEYTKYHRIGQRLGAGYRLLVLPDREVVAGRLPRRRLGDLVAEYASMIRREQPEGPYHLMGDCLGGIDAFGVACSLQRSGSEVGSLVLLDTLAPVAPVVRSMAGEGLSAYKSLPERRHPLRHYWFRIRLSIAVMTRGWWHPVPGSRTELFGQAMAYGLFDPSVHARECPVFEGDPEERFSHYIGQGHLQRIAPSGTFNAYRYKKNVPGFDIRTDNPVLHALLIGMRSRFIARKVFRYAKIDNRRSDLMAARSFIRRELFHPGTFRGRIDVVMSSRIHDRRPTGGWERHTAGEVRRYRANGDHRSYLGTFLSETAAIIGDILNGRPVKGESRDDAQDRRGLRSGGLQ
jgi:amino acid adenylation domain-containing protein